MEIYVVIPNWNGAGRVSDCLDSLLRQTQKHQIIVVDNGSVDESVEIIEKNYPGIPILKNAKNLGFAGGVNTGIKYALEQKAKYIALLNNDAVADKNWLKSLVKDLDSNPRVGICTSKIVDSKKTHLDSTGDYYTVWGLPYPRGRGEEFSDKYDSEVNIFAASGGASLYRAKVLKEIGLFDEDFFAYYEDVDISFRAQLAGWKINYVPGAVVYHEISATSSQIKDFATYQTIKNLPWLMWKNVPWGLMPKIFPRFCVAYISLISSALARKQFKATLKGVAVSLVMWPKKMIQRYKIQGARKVTPEYISSIIVHDLPPSAHKLRKLFRKLAT